MRWLPAILLIISVTGCGGRVPSEPAVLRPEVLPPIPENQRTTGPDPTWLPNSGLPSVLAEEDDPDTLVLDDTLRQTIQADLGFLLGVERQDLSSWSNYYEKRSALVTHPDLRTQDGQTVLEVLLGNRYPTWMRMYLWNDRGQSWATDSTVVRMLREHPALSLIELTAERPRPTSTSLDGIEVIFLDLPFSGRRDDPAVAIMGAVLEEAARHDALLVVLDRPPQMSTTDPDGMIPEAITSGTRESWYPIPLAPAMTLGELATLFNTHFGVQARLTVVPMKDWSRHDSTMQTQPKGWNELSLVRDILLSVEAPADFSNLEDRDGVAVLRLRPRERTAAVLLEDLQTQLLPGVETTVAAEELELTTSGPIQPVRLATTLHVLLFGNPEYIAPQGLPGLYGTLWVRDAIRENIAPDALARLWTDSAPWREFLQQRQRSLLYEP